MSDGKSGSQEKPPSELIDARIKELDDWRAGPSPGFAH